MACEYQIRVEVEDQEREIQVQPEAYNQASGGKIEITENGTYDVTKYQEAEVDVPLDIGQAFNTTITPTSGTSASSWYQKEFVNWDVMPALTFTIDPTVTWLNNIFQFCNMPTIKLAGGENVAQMSRFASDAEQLQSVDFTRFRPNGLTDISYAFPSCGSLTVLNLGGLNTSKVTNMSSLGDSCSVLKYVNLSGWTTEALTNNSSMFSFSRKLEAVVIDSPSVFRLTNSDAFNGTPISGNYTTKGYVYVPDDLVDEYKSATNWATYANAIKPLSELPQEVKDVFDM